MIYRMLPERPEETEGLDAQADAILSQLSEILKTRRAGNDRGVVLVGGVQGRRGFGKTSILHAIGRRALADSEERQWKVLSDQGLPRLFEPAKNSEESLLADLMEHLAGGAGAQCREDACLDDRLNRSVSRVYRELARKREPKAFIEIATEESPSTRRLPDSLGLEIQRRAQSNGTLAQAVSDRFDQVAGVDAGSNKALLLLVDDFDLAAGTVALDFFELVHRYLMVHPGRASVVLLVAYDRETLAKSLASIDGSSQLAWAKIAKYIPYTWEVRTLSGRERLELLWSAGDGQPVLEQFWSSDPGVIAILNKAIKEDEKEKAISKEDEKEKAISREAFSASMLASPLLPIEPRLVKRIHNRHIAIFSQIKQGMGADDLQKHFEGHFKEDGRSLLDERAIRPFVSMVIAADVAEPALNLWPQLMSSPIMFFDWLRDKHNGDGLGRTQKIIFNRLANAVSAWSGIVDDEGTAPFGVALSVNADATEAISGWRLQFEANHRVHLDLRAVIDARHTARPDELPRLLAKLAEAVRRTSLGDRLEPLHLVARAPLPMMTWLGWYLNRQRVVTAMNIYGGRSTPFTGPLRPLEDRPAGLPDASDPATVSITERPEDTERTERTEETERPEDNGSGALFVIELFGQATDLDTIRLLDTKGELLRPKVRVQIHRPPDRGAFEPGDLAATLQFVIDYIGEIHSRYDTERTYLCLRMPDVVAFFLGHNIRPGLGGEVILTKFEPRSTPPTYHAVGRLDDPPADR